MGPWRLNPGDEKSPLPPFKKRGNCKELLLKSPFAKGDLGGFENLQTEGIYGKRYKSP